MSNIYKSSLSELRTIVFLYMLLIFQTSKISSQCTILVKKLLIMCALILKRNFLGTKTYEQEQNNLRRIKQEAEPTIAA